MLISVNVPLKTNAVYYFFIFLITKKIFFVFLNH